MACRSKEMTGACLCLPCPDAVFEHSTLCSTIRTYVFDWLARNETTREQGHPAATVSYLATVLSSRMSRLIPNTRLAEAAAAEIRRNTGNPEVSFSPLDLARLSSVRAFANSLSGRCARPVRRPDTCSERVQPCSTSASAAGCVRWIWFALRQNRR